jgi:hypothetical protein
MNMKLEGRVPIIADVVSGLRTALTGGPPSGRKLETGELLIVDLVPRVRPPGDRVGGGASVEIPPRTTLNCGVLFERRHSSR